MPADEDERDPNYCYTHQTVEPPPAGAGGGSLMPFVKIEYGSSYNISVRGTEYFEVEADENGDVPASVIDAVWQEAVNDFMSDTCGDVVANEGD